MGIHAYKLGEGQGTCEGEVVFLCSCTGLPLPISAGWFNDLDDAEEFLQWLTVQPGPNPATLNAAELENQLKHWHRTHEHGVLHDRRHLELPGVRAGVSVRAPSR